MGHTLTWKIIHDIHHSGRIYKCNIIKANEATTRHIPLDTAGTSEAST